MKGAEVTDPPLDSFFIYSSIVFFFSYSCAFPCNKQSGTAWSFRLHACLTFRGDTYCPLGYPPADGFCGFLRVMFWLFGTHVMFPDLLVHEPSSV